MSAAVAHVSRRASSLAPPAYRRHAGHAAHFLQRLDRVDPRQAELALALYRDPALVEATLAYAKLPGSAERVAISLEHPRRGPFIIVTREGRFVTCLGRDMRPRHPVITRAQLDEVGRVVARLREVIAQAEAAMASPGRVRRMIARVLDGAEHVSREQIEELLRWEPLLGTMYVTELARCASQVLMAMPTVRNIVRPRARHEELLHSYHRALYALGHLYVLCGASEDAARRIATLAAEGPLQLTLSAFGVCHDVRYVASRALWAISRWPALMDTQLGMLRDPGNTIELADGYFGVAAIGLADAKRRKAARRAIEAERPCSPHLAEPAFVLRSHLSICFAQRRDVHDWGLARARMRLSLAVPGLREEDIDDADARAYAASAPGHAARTPDDVAAFATALPCLVTSKPEELYLSERIVERLRAPWSMEKTIALLSGHREAYGRRLPVRVVRVAARNDLCPCGSGRKLKRCCPDAGRRVRLRAVR